MRDWQGLSNKYLEVVIATALLLLATAFYLWRLSTHEHAFLCDNIVMGADGREILDGLAIEAIGYDAFKRPLFSILAGLPVLLLRDVLGFDPRTAALLSLSFWAGTAITLVYMLVRRHFAKALISTLVTLCFAMSFSTVTIFSIPETYGVTTAVLAFLLMVVLETDRARVGARFSTAMLVGVVAGFGAFAFPPLIAVLAFWFIVSAQRHGIRPVLLPGAIAGVIALAVYYGGLVVVFGSEAFAEQGAYIGRFGSLAGLMQWDTHATVASVFYWMGLVSPQDSVLSSYGLTDWSGYSHRPIAMLALVALGVIYLGIAIELVRRIRSEPVISGLIVLLAAFGLFFAFFNPQEAMLYAVLGALLLWLTAAWAWRQRRHVAILMAISAALFISVNLTPLETVPACWPQLGREVVTGKSQSDVFLTINSESATQ